DIAICPSCSLIIRVIFDPLDIEDEEESQSEEEEDGAEIEEDHFEDAMQKLSLTSEPDQRSFLRTSIHDRLDKIADPPPNAP
ncbi:hypothetical protein B0H12DRAFT_1114028, partial [Mycena haematopus]